MSQLVYNIDTTIAVEGNLADTGMRVDVISRVALAPLPCARLLVIDTTASLEDRGVQLPTTDFTGLGTVEGILIWDGGKVKDPVTGFNYEAGDELPVLRSGRVWVLAENASPRGGQAFARFTSGGGGSVLGRIRSNADTGSAAAIPSARFTTTTTGTDELVIVEINLPTTSAV